MLYLQKKNIKNIMRPTPIPHPPAPDPDTTTKYYAVVENWQTPRCVGICMLSWERGSRRSVGLVLVVCTSERGRRRRRLESGLKVSRKRGSER
jgi:hypothetical protein